MFTSSFACCLLGCTDFLVRRTRQFISYSCFLVLSQTCSTRLVVLCGNIARERSRNALSLVGLDPNSTSNIDPYLYSPIFSNFLKTFEINVSISYSMNTIFPLEMRLGS